MIMAHSFNKLPYNTVPLTFLPFLQDTVYKYYTRVDSASSGVLQVELAKVMLVLILTILADRIVCIS